MMRIIPETPGDFIPELDNEFIVEDLQDLWNRLNSIKPSAVLIPKTDDKGDYFEIIHPYEY